MTRGVVICAVMVGVTACSQSPNAGRACTPPRTTWQSPQCIECGLEAPRISFEIDHDSKLYQDGKPLSLDDLPGRLTQISKLKNPDVLVHLETEMGANCSTVEKVRNLFEQHLDCSKFGQCAEGNKDVWREWPIPPGTPPS